MPPKTMDEVEMLRALRLKQKKDKAAENPTSASVGGQGASSLHAAGGNQPSDSRKRQKFGEEHTSAGGTSSLPPPTGQNNDASAPDPTRPITSMPEKWWAYFNEFEGATSIVTSIFDRRFPLDQLVDQNLNLKEDRTRVQKAGMKNLGKKIQSTGAQMAFFGLCVDQYVLSAEKEMKKLLIKNKEFSEKLQRHEGDMKTVERLKTDLQNSETKTELLAEKSAWTEKYTGLEKNNADLKKKYDDLVVDHNILGSKVTTLTTEKTKLTAENGSLKAELDDAKAQVAMQHAAGFDKVVHQLRFLYPDLKVDEVGAFKHIVDGKLVDIVIDEDNE